MELDRFGHRFQDAVGDRRGLFRSADVLEEDRELVAPIRNSMSLSRMQRWMRVAATRSNWSPA